MEYELSILDRLVLMQVMAAIAQSHPTGGRMFFREFNRINEEISFTQDDKDEFDIQIADDGGRVTWDDAKARSIPLDIPECVERMIVKRLKEMNEAEELLAEFCPVYDKFVPDTEEEDE